MRREYIPKAPQIAREVGKEWWAIDEGTTSGFRCIAASVKEINMLNIVGKEKYRIFHFYDETLDFYKAEWKWENDRWVSLTDEKIDLKFDVLMTGMPIGIIGYTTPVNITVQLIHPILDKETANQLHEAFQAQRKNIKCYLTIKEE